MRKMLRCMCVMCVWMCWCGVVYVVGVGGAFLCVRWCDVEERERQRARERARVPESNRMAVLMWARRCIVCVWLLFVCVCLCFVCVRWCDIVKRVSVCVCV